MKKLASKITSSCIDIVNAMTDFSVPGGITFKKIKRGRQIRKWHSMHCFTKKKEFDGNELTAFFLQNANFFKHSHLKEIVDSSDDVKGSVEGETDSNNDKEEKENDDYKAENIKKTRR